jgi:hypothetical protein
MTEPSEANLQLAIVLPLGVIANQLKRIEADLRFLNMKALLYAQQNENGGIGSKITAQLGHINEALDLIRGLASDIQADMQPQISRKPTPARDD